MTATVTHPHVAEAFLALARDEAGLLVQAGQGRLDDHRLRFVHRTFQEYFAAAHLDGDLDLIRPFLRDHLHDPHWREVTLLLFGLLNPTPATRYLQAILDGISRRSGGPALQALTAHDLIFVGDCLAEGGQVQVRFAEEIIGRLVTHLVTTPIARQRDIVTNLLERLVALPIYRTAFPAVLLSRAGDRALPPEGRAAAAQALYYLAPRGTPEREQAAAALAALVADRALPPEGRVAAAQALYDLTPPGAPERGRVVAALAVLAADPAAPSDGCVAAAQALQRLAPRDVPEHEQAMVILLHHLAADTLDPRDRLSAAQALYRASRPWSALEQQSWQALEPLLHSPAIPAPTRATVALDLFGRSLFTPAQAHALLDVLSPTLLPAALDVGVILRWEKEWPPENMSSADLAAAATLAHDPRLLDIVRDHLYRSLSEMIPLLH